MGDPAARLLELSRWFSVTMNLNYFSKKTHKISIYTTFVLIVGISLYIPSSVALDSQGKQNSPFAAQIWP